MTSILALNRLAICNPKGDEAIIYLPSEGKKVIVVGSDEVCDVCYNIEEVRWKHFEIYENDNGQVRTR